MDAEISELVMTDIITAAAMDTEITIMDTVVAIMEIEITITIMDVVVAILTEVKDSSVDTQKVWACTIIKLPVHQCITLTLVHSTINSQVSTGLTHKPAHSTLGHHVVAFDYSLINTNLFTYSGFWGFGVGAL